MRNVILQAAALLAACAPMVAGAQEATVQVPGFTLPPSNYLSAEARGILQRQLAEMAPDFKDDIAAARRHYRTYNDDRLAEMRAIFATRETQARIGGVPVHVVTPAAGIAQGNERRVLINVHGGAFMWGSGSGALVEAIPVAATMGVKVVTVDYRLAPEHRYPAASEDVAAVYSALLKDYPAANIGIYGCSAGGIITAQSVAWFQSHDLPRPGAIGSFCGTGAPYGGDSVFIAPLAAGAKPMVPGTQLPDVLPTRYMTGVPARDPMAYPISSDAALAKFPPTLLLAGSRDFAASALTFMHRRLAAAGVESQLHLFDGLPHAFFVWPAMPESREAYRLMASFFDRHLGRGGK